MPPSMNPSPMSRSTGYKNVMQTKREKVFPSSIPVCSAILRISQFQENPMPEEGNIRKTLARFASSFDQKDWTLLESVLTDELTVDYSDLRGDPPAKIAAGEYVEARRQALEPLSTRHVISNLEITIEGRRAAVTASSVIFRRRGSAFFNTHATYQFGLSQHTQRG